MTTRNSAEPLPGGSGKRGRPRVWTDEAQKQRAHRAARRERTRLLDELLQAMCNAHWDEPELQQVINHGSEAEILQALIVYYRQRHWMRRSSQSEAPSGREK